MREGGHDFPGFAWRVVLPQPTQLVSAARAVGAARTRADAGVRPSPPRARGQASRFEPLGLAGAGPRGLTFSPGHSERTWDRSRALPRATPRLISSSEKRCEAMEMERDSRETALRKSDGYGRPLSAVPVATG